MRDILCIPLEIKKENHLTLYPQLSTLALFDLHPIAVSSSIHLNKTHVYSPKELENVHAAVGSENQRVGAAQ